MSNLPNAIKNNNFWVLYHVHLLEGVTSSCFEIQANANANGNDNGNDNNYNSDNSNDNDNKAIKVTIILMIMIVIKKIYIYKLGKAEESCTPMLRRAATSGMHRDWSVQACTCIPSHDELM